MKIFLYIALVLHILVEGIVGLLLIFAPTTMAADVDAAGLPYLIYYGCAGVTISLLVAWFWPHRHNVQALSIVLGTLATFHTTVALGGGIVVAMGGGLNIIATHGLFALGFWVLWARRRGLANA